MHNDRDEMMNFMEQQLHKMNAEVGTFFYDITNEKLFLTDSILAKEAHNVGIVNISDKQVALINLKDKDYFKTHFNIDIKNVEKTTLKTHLQIWNENEMSGNYTQCPRGRVFFNENEKVFDVMVGKWAEKYPQLLEQVKKRFHLENENVQLCYDSHWDIGNGFHE